jgi:ubiquinone/menaquinone biosynthesis C-methylase UbiE
MEKEQIQEQWEAAAPGWARWEETVANWIEPATETMLQMAGVDAGVTILDLACGAGTQTITAAHRAGPKGKIVAPNPEDVVALYHVAM